MSEVVAYAAALLFLAATIAFKVWLHKTEHRFDKEFDDLHEQLEGKALPEDFREEFEEARDAFHGTRTLHPMFANGEVIPAYEWGPPADRPTRAFTLWRLKRRLAGVDIGSLPREEVE